MMNMIIFSRYAHLETILEIICNHTSSTCVHKYVLIANKYVANCLPAKF